MSSSKTSKPGYERWVIPEVTGKSINTSGGAARATPPTAIDIEALQQQAYEEGFELGKKEGYETGLKQAQEDIQQRVDTLETTINALNKPLDKCDEEVIQQTAELAMAVARHILRRELKQDPTHIIGVVRESLSALPVSARNVRVYLNPEDAAIVREALSLDLSSDDSEISWKMLDEPLMSRGGCKVTAENSTIDATIEKQLNRIIATVLGGERADDEAE